LSNASAMRRKPRRERSEARTAFRAGQRGENKFTKKEGIHLVPGGLEGWHAHETPEQRHAAIRKVVRREGWQRAVRRLNLLANLDENTHPGVSRIAREDLHWVQKNYSERGY
jgi:Family of unknown function (DUF5771)